MSHIVIDAREYSSSTGRYISRLIQYLEQIDKKNDYTILLREADFGDYNPATPRFKKVISPYKEFTFGEQLGFASQLKKLNADLVHFGMTQQPLLYRKSKITTIHDLTTARFNNPDKKRTSFVLKQHVYKYVIKRAARTNVAIITPSEFVKSDLMKFAKIPSSKVIVTYEAADPIIETPIPLPDLQKTKFIMYVGRPNPHKNLERLIEAFALLHSSHPELRLVLAGKIDNNYSRIAEGVKKRGMKQVLFTDFVSEGQLRWLYEHCEAYVFPSLSEGFGLPGLEAMAHGAPVVSSNATCLPEIYGEAAQYFDPYEVQSIADAIYEVLTYKQLRNSLISRGEMQVREYSWKRMAAQTLSLYEEVLTTQRA